MRGRIGVEERKIVCFQSDLSAEGELCIYRESGLQKGVVNLKNRREKMGAK